MMNQLCQGKQLPDSIYFMTFDSRGNNKDRKMTRKGKSEKRNRTTGNRERNEREMGKNRGQGPDSHTLSMTKTLLVGGELIYKPRVCFGKWQKDNTVQNGLKHTKLLVWLFNTDHVRKGGHYNIIFTDTFVFLLSTTLLSGQYLISPHPNLWPHTNPG